MKMWKVIAAVAVMAMSAGMVYAADGPTTAPTSKPAAAKPVRGVIKEMGTGDTPDVTITVRAGKQAQNAAPKTQVISTTADTVVKGNGDKKTVKELEVGQIVSVTLDDKGEKAVSIEVVKPMARNNGGGANVPGGNAK